MNQPGGQRWMIEILRRAADDGPVPATGHLIGDGWEDEELLACWESGLLTAGQREEIVQHLALCPTCRRGVVAMIRSGRLKFQQTASELAADLSMPRPIVVPPVAWWRSRRFYGMAIAACLLVGLASVFWRHSAGGPRGVLALAERQLRSGQPADAMRSLEPLWDRALPAGLEANAKAMLGEAGSRAAAEKLARKDFRGVLEIESRVARRAGPSGELANLRLQAERGIPARVALDQMGTLIDYGYELDGSSPRKALPIMDQTTDRLNKEYQGALAVHPDNLDLLLNRGHFLLSQSRWDEAKRCFSEALQANPGSAAAEVGLGLIEFDAGRAQEALAHFRSALKSDPRNVAAQVNAGICLFSRGQKAEARRLWQQSLELTQDPTLRQRLNAQLKQP